MSIKQKQVEPTEERAFEATALIDATSMEGLQAQSRPGSSMPPPPASDAQMTSVLDTGKLNELVGESGPGTAQGPGPDAVDTVAPPARAQVATSSRSKYTPTLRSADFEAKQGPRLWPLLLGVVVFGAGVGTFMGSRTIPAAQMDDSVELIVRVAPAEATVRLDGELLSGKPHTSKRPKDGKRRTVVVEAPGYAPQTIDVVFDTSSTVDVSLSRTGR